MSVNKIKSYAKGFAFGVVVTLLLQSIVYLALYTIRALA